MKNLRSIAERYRLRIGELQVWAPYWINSAEDPFWLDAPYRGKATPGQLEYIVNRNLKLGQVPSNSTAEVRNYMTSQGLGVDCSGFVYHVLDQWLQQSGLRLAQFLVIDRPEIEERNRRRPELARSRGKYPLPVFMPLQDASRIWGTDSVYRTGVRRLLDRRLVDEIRRASQIKPGDMIGMTNKRGADHIGLVLELAENSIIYADSAYETGDGVSIRDIKINQWEGDLHEQSWDQRTLFHPGVNGWVDGVWRLRQEV